MALNGINLPLMQVGQEKIWEEVFAELGVTINNFVTGAAFLPWHRMGGLNGYAGPLPKTFLTEQLKLAKQIVNRMRSLGII
jgi:alpha-N-acetylglucosaminidase